MTSDATQVHARVLSLDAHADIVLPSTNKQYVARDGGSKVSPARMREGGLDAVVLSIAIDPIVRRDDAGYTKAREIADDKLAVVRRLVEDENGGVLLAKTADEVRAAKTDGRLAIVLGFQNALILGRRVADVDSWYEAGCRVFALTHMGHNDFADSSRPLYRAKRGRHEPEEEHGGLSELGRAAIDRIGELGGVVDVSQLSRNATLQTVDRARAPVVASHSNVRAISDVTRNLSDEEIDAIAASGGVVHVCSFAPYLPRLGDPELMQKVLAVRRDAGLPERFQYPFELYWEIRDEERQRAFLTAMRALVDDLSVEDMLDHVDYLAKRVGTDHIGVGNDLNHGTNVRGYRDASEAANFTAGLLRRGYAEEDVQKIWSGNFLRVMEAAHDARD